MLTIGIAGGVASGKSLVAEQLRELGAHVLDADRAGHEVLRENEVREALVTRWGRDILDESGEVNRGRVARIVFSPPPKGPQELSYLEKITHPRIGKRLQQQASVADDDGFQVVVIDAALLFKAGWDDLCDRIIFVEVPYAQRLQRAASRGWTAAQYDAREANQTPLETKRSRADWIVDNSQTPDETSRQVRAIWQHLGVDRSL